MAGSPDPLALSSRTAGTYESPRQAAFRAKAKRRRRFRIMLAVTIAVVAGVGVSIALADSLGYLGGPVKITSVAVTDSAAVLNITPMNDSYSSTTGGSVIVVVFAWNTMPVPRSSGVNDAECDTGATVSTPGFTVQALSPSFLCISAQNGTMMYITLGMPARTYTGSVQITIDDYLTIAPD
jgi:hypothetical protein